MFWILFLLHFLLTFVLVFPFVVPLDFNTFSNLIFVFLALSSSTDSATICYSSGDLAIQVHIFLYLLTANVIKLHLSMISPSLYLYFWCWVQLTNSLSPAVIYPLDQILHHVVAPLTSFGERLIVDLGLFIKILNIGVYPGNVGI